MSSPLGENQLIGASGNQAKDYEIEYSCRFDETTSTALTRTPTSNGNSQVATFSAWMKYDVTFCNFWDVGVAGGGSTQDSFQFGFNSNGACFTSEQNNNSVRYDGTTTALYRDPAAWYHVHFIINTPHATASERIKIYVNGVYQSGTYNYPSQNASLNMNLTSHGMRLGAGTRTGGALYNEYSGLIAEAHWLDGQAIGPENFGETDAAYGHWKPIEYEGGNYGTNGVYFKFDNASALGTDSSGNGNNYTLNNIGAEDQMIDTPTNNFCTLNPLTNREIPTLNGNLEWENTGQGGNNWQGIQGTMALPSSGKWYFEFLQYQESGSGTSWGNLYAGCGVIDNGTKQDSTDNMTAMWGVSDKGWGINNSGSSGMSYISALDVGPPTVYSIAVDMDNNTMKVAANGSAYSTLNFTLPSGGTYTPGIITHPNSKIGFNAGQDSSFAGRKSGSTNASDGNGKGDFYYTPPSGFLALCTNNLAAPTVKPKEHFNTVTYTGNSSTNAITGVGFEPSLVWIKERTASGRSHQLFDKVRGVNKSISMDTTGAQQTRSGWFNSFDSDGFTTTTSDQNINQNSTNYASWHWNMGSSSSTNNNGTAASTVMVNSDASMSIVQYEGTGSTQTLGHGLGKKPSLILLKNFDTTIEWTAYTVVFGVNNYWRPNENTGKYTASSGTDFWPGLVTTDVFGVGNHSGNNQNNHTYIAYCFAEIEGYSIVGEYMGNARTEGPFIHCGFRPGWIWVKGLTGAGASHGSAIWDTARNPYNVSQATFEPNNANREVTDAEYSCDILSNGFKLRYASNITNGVGDILFIAFAECPMKYANAR